jgi:hypothetical protein
MIDKNIYNKIAEKHGYYCSWALWAEQGNKPKSNIGDMRVFNFDYNPNLLNQLNPNFIMVGLNFSRKIEEQLFINFHDSRPVSQDYKIRYAFKDTKYYGAYMTDIIKDFEYSDSDGVVSYLKKNNNVEEKNIKIFQQEISDLKVDNPTIIAFGSASYNILVKYFNNKYRIIKVPHYSMHISKEDYRKTVAYLLD